MEKPTLFHHANVLISCGHEAETEIQRILSDFGMPSIGNPDIRRLDTDTFTIENAREISQAEELRPVFGDKKVFIIEANFITEEAQNALLKLFEEPTESTVFIFILPQDTLLPTLRSRVSLRFISNSNSDLLARAPGLKSGLNERMAFVKKLADQISDEEKTKQDAIMLINSIERDLYNEGVEKNHRKLEACQLARQSLLDRGAPIKMILENFMLSV